MPLESATYISDLNTANPDGTVDTVASLDNHVRLLKTTLKATFPNVTGAVTPTHTELNYVDGVTSAIQTQIDDANTLIATTAFSSALPAQTGNAGKFVTTDGTAASWAALPADASDLIYTARTSNTILGAADFTTATRKFIDITSGTFTQTLDAAATIGANGWLILRNSGTGIITLDPSGAELVNGEATQKIYPGESGVLVCTGSAFHVSGLAVKGAWLTLSQSLAINAAAADFANVFSSDFDEYEIVGVKCKPATDNVDLYLRTSTDGGATYDAGAGAYAYAITRIAAGGVTNDATSAAATQILLNGNGVGNAVGEDFSFTMRIFKPSAADHLKVEWNAVGMTSATAPFRNSGAGARLTAADVDSFRLLWSAGNFASGDVYVRGRKK